MKSELKKALFFLFIALAYISQSFTDAYPFSYVYHFGFIAVITLLYIIKNKYIGTFLGLGLLSAMDFYNSDYKYLTIIAFLLISAHKNLVSDTNNDKLTKNNSNLFSFICTQVSIIAGIALLVYDFILISQTDNYATAVQLKRAVMIFFWFIGVFVYSLSKSKNNKKSKNSNKIIKQISDNLKFMYLVSIIAFLATVLFTYAKINFISMDYGTIYLPWFIYVCTMVYNGDPYIKSMADSITSLLNKISYKDTVKL